MTDAMEVLLQYAEEQMVHPFLAQSSGYLHIRSRVMKQEEDFLSMLTKEMAEQFEKMVMNRVELNYLHDQALFRAGFQIATELFR